MKLAAADLFAGTRAEPREYQARICASVLSMLDGTWVDRDGTQPDPARAPHPAPGVGRGTGAAPHRAELGPAPVLARPGRVRVPPPVVRPDDAAARESVRRIAALDPAAVWLGHYGPIKDDVRGQLERAAEGP